MPTPSNEIGLQRNKSSVGRIETISRNLSFKKWEKLTRSNALLGHVSILPSYCAVNCVKWELLWGRDISADFILTHFDVGTG